MERVAEPRQSGINYTVGNMASMTVWDNFAWEVKTFMNDLPLTLTKWGYVVVITTLPNFFNLDYWISWFVFE